ncbi:beta-glucuronidase-like [Littorina saxatilis]|uniref:Beta-glucuronidase n=1 Tax=Littorina saxatilis TaxID=31220 RepID=A0AAN9AI53_9CAEN
MAGRCRLLRFLLPLVLWHGGLGKGILYPRDSESRVVKTLDGMWNFRADNSSTRNQSFVDEWWTKPLSQTGDVIPMPVPSSYNDITTDKSLRDFVGWVWYDRHFYVSKMWQDKRVMLRFGSVNYYAMVWINGQQVMSHEGGHLPFECEVNSVVSFSAVNRVTVAVNNTLTPTTIPPGTIHFDSDTKRYPAGYFVQNLQMDFFNYAGIQRSAHLYATPQAYVDDITIITTIQGTNGVVSYTVTEGGTGPGSAFMVIVTIEDRDGNTVSSLSTRLQDTIVIPDARLWWPWTMKPDDPGYMYALKVNVSGDVYRQPFGIRTVRVSNTQFFINDQPFYLHGVGRHEDVEIRGRGSDDATIARDFHMKKWLGVNGFRTAVYPFAEELMDQADRQGFVVVDETPGVGITQPDNFSPVGLSHHKAVMGELYQRDKNRPSVIMWSIANEPTSNTAQGEAYFKDLIAHTRDLDESKRPITFFCNKDYDTDRVAQFVDVILINRYLGWYSDVGHTEVIQLQLSDDLENWHAKFNKPLVVSEYGADTLPGLHREPSFIFTEEYQTDFMKEYFRTFDKYRSQFLVGEMIWCFADFITAQQLNRVVGNHKGVLTRERQPKASAHLLRERYLSLVNSTRTN